MNKIIVLGAGMVGSAIAADLSKNYNVSIADLNDSALNKFKSTHQNVSIYTIDVTQKEELKKLITNFNLVICAVPGFIGFQTLKTIIETGTNVVDISFFPENSLELNELAKEHNVTAIVDCGVAPGMGNIILGYHNEFLTITDFNCLVGGLPKVKNWPFNYKAPFSPIDVIEEYTRPARYVEEGNIIIKEALSDCEFVEFEKVGTLEAFNTDGLRSLIFTMPHIKNMKEKTMRYPGHIEYIKVLKHSGFFDNNKIKTNIGEISPLEFSSKVLFKNWKLEDDEAELTVMRIKINGENESHQKEEITYELYDEFDPKAKISSMARTTGYTATAAANLILNNSFTEKGIFPPELVGKHKICFDFIINYLSDRGVNYKLTSRIIS